MADNHSVSQRQYNMSQIHSQNTKPEEIVRQYLFSRGLRYRKNDKRYPGTPDIVLPRYKSIVFANGCFWHHHNCSRFHWPLSNVNYWKKKIDRNVQRDIENKCRLEEQGWQVLVIWECELKKTVREKNLKLLYQHITHKGDEA